MTRKLAVITGATSGIGLVGAQAIAQAGFDLILPCRNLDKARGVREQIQRAAPDAQVDVLHCDMDSLASVRDCAMKIREAHDNIDLLVNNAGLVALKLELTQDGIERSFGVNHLAHFVLTHHLMDALQHGDGARLVHTSSEAAYDGGAGFMDDVNYAQHKYRFFKAYCNSKLANLWFSNKLARDFKGRGIISNAFHPGRVATGIWPDSKWYEKLIIGPLKKFYLISPEQGARPLIKLALDEELNGVSGRFWFEMEQRDPGEKANDSSLQDRLWALSEDLAADFL